MASQIRRITPWPVPLPSTVIAPDGRLFCLLLGCSVRKVSTFNPHLASDAETIADKHLGELGRKPAELSSFRSCPTVPPRMSSTVLDVNLSRSLIPLTVEKEDGAGCTMTSGGVGSDSEWTAGSGAEVARGSMSADRYVVEKGATMRS